MQAKVSNHFRNHRTPIWSGLSILAPRLPGSLAADDPALTWIMTQYHAKDMCASELGPLRLYALHTFYWLIDWLID